MSRSLKFLPYSKSCPQFVRLYTAHRSQSRSSIECLDVKHSMNFMLMMPQLELFCCWEVLRCSTTSQTLRRGTNRFLLSQMPLCQHSKGMNFAPFSKHTGEFFQSIELFIELYTVSLCSSNDISTQIQWLILMFVMTHTMWA